ncbi:unnamed protein product [Trichobilharzia regenti]|nr:unnamed protein product [Trichobilharzia regenti]
MSVKEEDLFDTNKPSSPMPSPAYYQSALTVNLPNYCTVTTAATATNTATTAPVPASSSTIRTTTISTTTATKSVDEMKLKQSPGYALHLANNLKLFESCCLLKRLGELCRSLVKQLYDLQEKIYSLSELNTEQLLNIDSYNALQMICAMHYDPVLTALHIDLMSEEEETRNQPSVAQYLSYIYSIQRKGKPTATSMMTTKSSTGFKSSSSLESRVSSYICREAMGFMEVVLGNHRIVKQICSTDVNTNDSDDNKSSCDPTTEPIVRRAIFNKIHFTNFFSSSACDGSQKDALLLNEIIKHEKPPTLAFQASSLRLLCVLFMRGKLMDI